MSVHQLRHVLIPGGDHHVPPLLCGLTGVGADHVVGLHALDDNQRQPHGADNVVNRLHLLGQVLRHGRAVGLVFLEQLVAEGLALGIEDHRHRAVRVVLEQPAHHVDNPLDRAGGLPPGGGQRWQRVVGAIEVGGPIDQHDGGILVVGHSGLRVAAGRPR